ncbi:alpha-galactosidase [Amnibacterium sp. CER49]|uniref:alpha-galactosidase n=1 Tax=Amnibacterium sp. CER49 TaxID=3039161 RepID=UPI002448F288|nr:alpha-galactosidase [Amnibacterium sp. CER49]MDH2443960.1 alpha-galactosidase [Amnibacterium sp. CER49]
MPAPHRLANGGVALYLDTTGDDPVVVHWGADLGDVDLDPALLLPPVAHSMFDDPVRPSLLPQLSRGWRGRPAIRGSRGGRDFSPRLALTGIEGDGTGCTLRLADGETRLEAEVGLALTPSGLLLVDLAVTNAGEGDYVLDRAEVALPVPAHAAESLDTTGRWIREKAPQRRPIQQGTWVRSGRHGRTGHDAPAVMAAGTAGFGWRTGEVWAVHLGWSGDFEAFVDRIGSGDTLLGAGELLQPGEVALAPGETYRAPTVYAAWSPAGLDGVSARFHDWLRARPTHPSAPRPVVLNTWEAVYFAHDLGTLQELADTAASLGVERFVLDDGWFTGRRHDRAGLGDWQVDETVWPDGLTPLIEHVKDRGMQFGLWVEPEMINEDSDLARSHPDWISTPGTRMPQEWRHQQVVDLANPAAWQHILEALDAILTENAIDYLKWDQNRDQLELGSGGRASTHEQTLAAYRLLDELKRRHPSVEIESCSSGGARVDLGILARTDRIWTSDTNDALERQQIQRWTELLVPPELVGAHVGPTRSHSTGRVHDIGFRATTAMFGHFGIEWDVRQASDDERTRLAEAIRVHKAHRELIATGRMVRMDSPDPALQVTGVVAQDGSSALFSVAALATSLNEVPVPVRFGGLDPDRAYRVELALPPGPHALSGRAGVAWIDARPVLPGRVLAEIGLPMPILNPEQALLLTLTA